MTHTETDKDFLVEIGCAELPPKALRGLSEAFIVGVQTGLDNAGLSYAAIKPYTSPRRLAAHVEGLSVRQADTKIERFGPAVKAAYDKDGKPTPAASGFARSCGVDIDALETVEKDGVEKLVFRADKAGDDTRALLPDIVATAVAKLPIPRKMRWGSTRDEFVRPVYWLVMLFGDEVIDTELFGIKSGRITHGHRFHCDTDIHLASPSEYEDKLLNPGFVIADYDRRKHKVRELVEAQGTALNAEVRIDEDLLEEVTSMVEWPVALTGRFDEHFLSVPPEALISSMKNHQKTFYVLDKAGNMLPNFVAVANLESKDPAQVIAGNERVIRPRLADAAFFFESDRKQTLASRLEQLGSIVFQQQLGTVEQKSRRVAALAGNIARALTIDPAHCERAALLGKCDLVSHMVAEFPELQGIMGHYYALHDNEASEVAQAITEQYQPRFAGDAVPASDTGAVLAVAEKLDTICGLFAIGQPPTGSKDPFALRRAALGVLRILVEKSMDLDLQNAINEALAAYTEQGLVVPNDTSTQVFEFMLERFRAWYTGDGVSPEVFQSVMELKPAKPLDFALRVSAVQQFSKLPESGALAAANKRVSNILQKQEGAIAESVDKSLLTEAAEIALAEDVDRLAQTVAPMFKQRDYAKGLETLAGMRTVVDTFFDDVLVMADDAAVRQNRLALLRELRTLFLHVADISCLHTA
ncbi:glycine--tRNA ligase subunit beta [Pseudohongiella sp.]|uniref:glycine--tRNA ligase n=1 Tax=marine sediment metagenome TaxID=412755 RepID=A0A0F9YA69_9ZZZZ|nr:glycine--tRNA ligase subunit beta [Pseudohongiella sp.]HDZ08669.1 glycine--tRNA ligase subunit beta [Pseudohongiella sp.]HEA62285.1 glycine--tRNA ligase subunit beta [Pseudohongiella sp.]